MKKKMLELFLMVAVATCVSGCSSTNDQKTQEEQSEDWRSPSVLQSHFDDVVEMDVETLMTTLNEISWAEYDVCGYAKLNDDIIYLYDSQEPSDDDDKVYLSGDDASEVNDGDMVYIHGQGYIGYYKEEYQMYYISADSISTSPDSTSEPMSIEQYCDFLDKVYGDITFKSKGVIYQDGTHYDGTPQYYLYPSDESKNEQSLLRVELELANDTSVIVGKQVQVVGNPDPEAIIHGLQNCHISEE